MINLEIIGQPTNRIYHLSNELQKIGVEISVHELPKEYQPSGIKILKRIKIRKALLKQILSAPVNRSSDITVFLVSIYPPLYAPILKELANNYHTILDVRNTYQEWVYHPFLKRRIEKWEQVSTMKKVDAITYAHRGLHRHLVKHVKNKNKLHFISNGANDRIFNTKGKTRHLSDARLNLIYSGRFSWLHHTIIWLEIMKELQKSEEDVHLTLIGYGKGSVDIDRLINKYQLKNVSFYNGKVSQSILAEHIRGADYAVANVNPQCHELYETTIETKTFEALCCGVNVLSIMGQATTDFNSEHQLHNSINFDGLSNREISQKIAKLPVFTTKDREELAKKSHFLFSFRNGARKYKKLLEEVVHQF